MEITTEQQGDIAVLKCEGSLDADTVAHFKKITGDLVDRGVIRFVVDGSKMTFVDSMGLGVLISLLRRVKQREGDIKVAALTADVKSIFEITRLHRLFEVCGSTKEAVEKFKV